MASQKKQTDKSKRILDAVSSILTEKGYGEATINQVAAKAGVSRGLLHYYFKSKEDMMAQAVRTGAKVSLDLVDEVFKEKRNAEEMARGFVDGLQAITEGDPEFIHLLFEGWAVSRRSRVVADEVRKNYRLFREAVCRELEKALEEGRIISNIPAQALAFIIIGLFDGLGLQLLMEPELLSRQEIYDAVQAVVRLFLTTEC